MMLRVFFSGDVNCHKNKEIFSYSFCVKMSFRFVIPDNSLDVLCFFMFMCVNKNI